MRFVLALAIVGCLCTLTLAQSEDTTGLGYLQAFSALSHEDITASNSNTRGRMAAGGNVNLQSYSVGQALTFQCMWSNYNW